MIRLRINRDAQFVESFHRLSMGRTSGKERCTKVRQLHEASRRWEGSLHPLPIPYTIRPMELVKLLSEIVIGWIRDTLVNIGGRLAEEFIGKRLKRRKRRHNRRQKSGSTAARVKA